MCVFASPYLQGCGCVKYPNCDSLLAVDLDLDMPTLFFFFLSYITATHTHTHLSSSQTHLLMLHPRFSSPPQKFCKLVPKIVLGPIGGKHHEFDAAN